jgi:hypothetical protein
MGISDDCQPALVNSFPKLVALLTDSNTNARVACAGTLAKLSKTGKQNSSYFIVSLR